MHFTPLTIEKVQNEMERLAASDFTSTGDDCSSTNSPLGFLNFLHFLNYFIDFQNKNFLLKPKIA
jgi:hypothetical protein